MKNRKQKKKDKRQAKKEKARRRLAMLASRTQTSGGLDLQAAKEAEGVRPRAQPLSSRQEGGEPPQRNRPALESAKKPPAARVKHETEQTSSPAFGPETGLYYVLEAQASGGPAGVFLHVVGHQPEDQRIFAPRLRMKDIAAVKRAIDRDALAYLAGTQAPFQPNPVYDPEMAEEPFPTTFRLSESMQRKLVPSLVQAGRLCVDAGDRILRRLAWDGETAWEFWAELVPSEQGGSYSLVGLFRREGTSLPLKESAFALPAGFVFWKDHGGRLNDSGAPDLLLRLFKEGPVQIPVNAVDDCLERLLPLLSLNRVILPVGIGWEDRSIPPRPKLTLHFTPGASDPSRNSATLSFLYGECVVAENALGEFLVEIKARRRTARHSETEKNAAKRIEELSFARAVGPGSPGWEIASKQLPRALHRLAQEGWHLEAEGKLFRPAGAHHLQVRSGIDWFELDSTFLFEDVKVRLPELLKAVQRGENMVALPDGSVGVFPEEWISRFALLAGFADGRSGLLRFIRGQASLLEALLAPEPKAEVDEGFHRAVDELRHFDGIRPANAPPTFHGTLRDYQREGLGWLFFLQKFGFGGCLADDMGLGKTIEALALLETKRHLAAVKSEGVEGLKPKQGPFLVVAPSSVVFNWRQEAARFCPEMKVLEHIGSERETPGAHFHDYDLVLTSYATLRRDIVHLREFEFDVCILDESQAIKNADTETARAARLLKARHRLALSGTPIENHLGELWSLFEFLNPGLLGNATSFQRVFGKETLSNEEKSFLSRALRPFIFRRTKSQVVKDLPLKHEQILYCEMEGEQRQLYEELRDYYRQSLLAKVEREGLNQSKIQVLEALLRLRQAALHPGLIDTARSGESCAKLDLLLPNLQEVVEEGAKALVFSQFTSMLAIARDRLDRESLTYEYLDGSTIDRQKPVERFQTDPECRLFLISLRAGGLGLNLTAAEYVFILDPWWNPAVEAQAIDRTHRIGQTKPVFAYRLIAHDTVEEKVLELQEKKRDLAEAIIQADSSLLRTLTREDLELLLR